MSLQVPNDKNCKPATLYELVTPNHPWVEFVDLERENEHDTVFDFVIQTLPHTNWMYR